MLDYITLYVNPRLGATEDSEDTEKHLLQTNDIQRISLLITDRNLEKPHFNIQITRRNPPFDELFSFGANEKLAREQYDEMLNCL